MTREELLRSNEYWKLEIQMELFRIISEYMESNNLNRTQLADKLGVTKGYISQILNGDFDHRISKLVQLAMVIGKVPRIDFIDIEEIFKLDELDLLHEKPSYSTKIYNAAKNKPKFSNVSEPRIAEEF